MVLSPDELRELTGKRKPHAQRVVLTALGIPHRTRPDGSLVVMRQVVQTVLEVSEHRPQLRLPA